jgi:YfiH family protein
MMLDIAMLPQPTDAFEWMQAAAGPGLVCRPLARLAPHVFTTRGWTLGSRTGATDAAWEEVAAAVHVDPRHLIHLHQVHGAAVVVHRAGAAVERGDADIVISDDPASAVAIQTADCVPLIMSDGADGAGRRNACVAAAHAGWRGLAARVPAAVIEALAREFGCRPADLVAAIGPSIGACCYEVGDDVRRRFAEAGFSEEQLGRWFVSAPQPSVRNLSMAGLPAAPRAGHWFFDSWSATREQLIVAGVPAGQIYSADLCTASHAEAFCSHRRDGAPAGRLAAVVRARGAASTMPRAGSAPSF